MAWSLKLDREREWPAGTMIGEIGFRDPTLRIMRGLPAIEEVRTYPDKSTTYEIRWDAVDAWLLALVAKPEDAALIAQLSPSEAERAKETLVGFFTSGAGASGKKTPPTTSASAPASEPTRID
ncbi:hypothetical protein [Bosea sp. (in: a-proteobacteria)]|uniref:hypothetical protein n=1 Tax=Bosea sp. (in: a-proteobacteria) TaxID=1871050 RepID=UPI003B3B2432